MPSLPSMPRFGNIAFAGGTVAVALVTGFLMQSGSSDRETPKRVASLEPNAVLVKSPETRTTVDSPAQPVPVAEKKDAPSAIAPAAAIVSQAPEAADLTAASLGLVGSMVKKSADKPNLGQATSAPAEIDERIALAPISGEQEISLPALKAPAAPADCKPSLAAEPTAAAMVHLSFRAPCNTGERVIVHHNGMMFTEVTDDAGKLSIKVPALAENALFMVSLATGKTVVANTEVTSLEFYDRALIQWKGQIGLQIHALEFGASYGEEGHVWAENAGNVQRVVSGESGYITRYGDASSPDALFAEVYTFPTLTSKQEGTVQLSVEAEIASATCDREIEAQSIQYISGKKLRVQDLALQMPACDSFGGYLVLKNLLEDLTIANR